MAMGDRIVVMSNAVVQQIGAPHEVYSDPANLFVARFIGTPPMNLLALEPGNDGAVIAGTTGPAVAPRELAGSTLGVRPEHVVLARDAGVDAQIDGIEYLGADSLLTCRVGAQPLAVRVAGRVGLSQGDATRLSWARGAQHFFDGTSGRRSQKETSYDSATMFA